MARLPRPSKNYDPLNMARELNAAIDASKPTNGGAPAENRGVPQTNRGATDYRRTLFESLFQ